MATSKKLLNLKIGQEYVVVSPSGTATVVLTPRDREDVQLFNRMRSELGVKFLNSVVVGRKERRKHRTSHLRSRSCPKSLAKGGMPIKHHKAYILQEDFLPRAPSMAHQKRHSSRVFLSN